MHTRHSGPLAHARWLVPAAALTLLGCPDDELAPLEPCTVAAVTEEITQTGVDTVDLLFMIDNSGSMSQEQANIAKELPRLVRVLASGDWNGDGVKDPEDFQPVSNLHLGVVSSNMGTSGVPVKFCSGNGDDGKLIHEVRIPDATCATDIPAYQEFVPPADDAQRNTEAEAVAKTFACVANLGTEGCGFEQQLEAIWKALAPSSDTSFIGGTGGHGDQENAGFLRDDAVLAIIEVSDEEDCSITAEGKELFVEKTTDSHFLIPNSGSPPKVEGINIRCALHSTDPALVRPVSRYIEGLTSLKDSDKQDRIIFAGIVGVPIEAEGLESNGVQDFDAILALDDMQIKPNGDIAVSGTQPVRACESGNGKAYPARRTVELAKAFGENGLVRSICQADFGSALDAILAKVSKQLSGACLPRELNANDKGIVECDVVEILARGQTKCDEGRGRKFYENREVAKGDTRTVCKVNQVAVQDTTLVAAPSPIVPSNALTGWYYDNFTEEVTMNCKTGEQQRIAFTKAGDAGGKAQDAAPASGALTRFECFSPVGGSPQAKGKAAVGSPCQAGDVDVCKAERSEEGDGYKLKCDLPTRTCQIICEADSDCPQSWVCDTDHTYCVNPTCPPTQSTGEMSMSM